MLLEKVFTRRIAHGTLPICPGKRRGVRVSSPSPSTMRMSSRTNCVLIRQVCMTDSLGSELAKLNGALTRTLPMGLFRRSSLCYAAYQLCSEVAVDSKVIFVLLNSGLFRWIVFKKNSNCKNKKILAVKRTHKIHFLSHISHYFAFSCPYYFSHTYVSHEE